MALNIAIIVITSLISLYAFYNAEIFDRLKFNAYAIKHRNQGWRFFTYGLVHANWPHLLINMFVLYSFGKVVAQSYHFLFGTKGYLFFLLLYVGGILFSVLFDFGKQKDNPGYNAVGASGAVSAIVFASILLYPSGSLYLFPIPFPIPSVVFGILYLVYTAYMARRGTDNIGHNAHFWGAIYGLAFTLVLKPGLAGMFWEQLTHLF
jgi:membrane associated rhomboid family serine protease